MVNQLLTAPIGADVIETCGGRVWLDSGIVHEIVDVATLELEHVCSLAEAVRSLVEPGTPALLLADLCSVRGASSDARAYASSQDLRSIVAAHAFIVGSPVTRIVASFFVRVFRPPFPTRLFTEPGAASAWLRGVRSAATG